MKNQKKNISRLFLTFLVFSVLVSCQDYAWIQDHDWFPDSSLIFSPAELQDAMVGQAYEVTISISNNDTPVFRIRIYGDEAEFPPGLNLNYVENTSRAVLSGVPEIAGEYEFIITAHCLGTNKNGQYGKQHYRLKVKK